MELKSLFLLDGDDSGRIFKPLNLRSTLIFFEHIRFLTNKSTSKPLQ